MSQTEHLTRKFDGLEDLNWQAFSGEMFGFLSPNGAGKPLRRVR